MDYKGLASIEASRFESVKIQESFFISQRSQYVCLQFPDSQFGEGHKDSLAQNSTT